jgi:hypothetical protein
MPCWLFDGVMKSEFDPFENDLYNFRDLRIAGLYDTLGLYGIVQKSSADSLLFLISSC